MMSMKFSEQEISTLIDEFSGEDLYASIHAKSKLKEVFAPNVLHCCFCDNAADAETTKKLKSLMETGSTHSVVEVREFVGRAILEYWQVDASFLKDDTTASIAMQFLAEDDLSISAVGALLINRYILVAVDAKNFSDDTIPKFLMTSAKETSGQVVPYRHFLRLMDVSGKSSSSTKAVHAFCASVVNKFFDCATAMFTEDILLFLNFLHVSGYFAQHCGLVVLPENLLKLVSTVLTSNEVSVEISLCKTSCIHFVGVCATHEASGGNALFQAWLADLQACLDMKMSDEEVIAVVETLGVIALSVTGSSLNGLMKQDTVPRIQEMLRRGDALLQVAVLDTLGKFAAWFPLQLDWFQSVVWVKRKDYDETVRLAVWKFVRQVAAPCLETASVSTGSPQHVILMMAASSLAGPELEQEVDLKVRDAQFSFIRLIADSDLFTQADTGSPNAMLRQKLQSALKPTQTLTVDMAVGLRD